MYDDNSGGSYGGGFGGLGSSLGNFFSNPMTLAAIQMMGNNTPKINAIPNTLEGVPTVLMSAQDRQRKMAEDARKRQQELAQQDALTQSLIYGGAPAAEARSVSASLPAVQLYQDQLNRRRSDEEGQRFDAGQPRPPQPTAPPDLAGVSSKFDAFGQSSLGKTIAEIAAQSGNQTTSAGFVNAARNQGLSPNSPITTQVLSDPATAMPLAKALGIGANLPDDQWQQAHADAFQASKARQAAQAAAQQAQAQQQSAPAPQEPVIPFTQTGPSPAVVPQQQQAPAPQQQAPAQPAPQQAPPAPQQTTTDRAVAIREQKRVEELQAKIDYNSRFMGNPNPRVKAQATEAVHAARQELAQKPQFTTIGKDEATGGTQYGFVHPDGTVTPYNPPKSAKDSAPVDERGLYPGNTVEERLQSVPADDRSFVQQMLDGRVAPPSSFAMKTPYWQHKMLQASRVDPELDYTKWGARAATRKDFDSGKTAQNLISMGQTYGHFGKLTDAIDKLDNSDFPLANKARNAVLGATGSDKATNVKTAAKAVSSEVARVFKGVGVIGEKEVKEWGDTLDPNMSPEQLKGSVRTLLDLIDSRVQEQGARWNSQFPNEPRELYSKSAEKALESVRAWSESGATRTASSKAAPSKSLNPFEAEMRRRGLLN